MNINNLIQSQIWDPLPLEKPKPPKNGDIYHDVKSGSTFVYDERCQGWKEVILTGKIINWDKNKKDFRKEKIDNIWHR